VRAALRPRGQVEELGTAEAAALWDALPAALRAPGLHPAYLEADALREPGLGPVRWLYREGQALCCHGFHLAPLPGEAGEAGWRDLQSPYGYGGPLVHPWPPPPGFLERVWAAHRAWCAERRVLAEFLRFHPLLPGAEAYGGEVRGDRDTVWVDLAAGPEGWRGAYQGRARTALRKARRLGLTVAWWGPGPFLEAFAPLYAAHMERLGAHPDYRFPRPYLEALVRWPAALRGVILDPEGRVVAAALFLAEGEVLEYHLAADRPEGRAAGAPTLLLDAAFERGAELGLRRAHLGGGRGPDPADALLRFKTAFSPRRARYRTGRWVHRPEAYEALRRRWPRPRPGRVLFYR